MTYLTYSVFSVIVAGAFFSILGWNIVFLTYPKQNQVHLKLGNPSADTASHSEAKRDRAKGIFHDTAITEPPLRYKCVRLWECVLISANGIVSKREGRLKEQQ